MLDIFSLKGKVALCTGASRGLGKAMAIGGLDGFIKIITEPGYGEILGVHMVGPHVTDLITEAVVAIRNELTVDELIASIHPHPTLAEVVQEAAYDALGRAIHK